MKKKKATSTGSPKQLHSHSTASFRDRLQADLAAFLASGGVIRQCDSGDNAGTAVQPHRTRQQQLAHQKRLDGFAMGNALAKRRGGAK
ncbi:MAG: hypothetical protein ACK5ME_10635 [Parahaliea sp.]